MQANYLIVKNEHGLRHLIEELQGLVSQLDVEGYQAASLPRLCRSWNVGTCCRPYGYGPGGPYQEGEPGKSLPRGYPECKPEFEGITVFTMEQNQLKWRSWNPGR